MQGSEEGAEAGHQLWAEGFSFSPAEGVEQEERAGQMQRVQRLWAAARWQREGEGAGNVCTAGCAKGEVALHGMGLECAAAVHSDVVQPAGSFPAVAEADCSAGTGGAADHRTAQEALEIQGDVRARTASEFPQPCPEAPQSPPATKGAAGKRDGFIHVRVFLQEGSKLGIHHP